MVNIIKLVKSLFTKDEGIIQQVRCKSLGKEQDLKVLNMYGISFNPPDNSFGVAFSANGYDDETFVMVDRPDKRWKGLEKGELKIGNYLTGSFVHFKADGTIAIEGNVVVNGTVTADNFITSSVPDYNAHTHSGVDTGIGNTGGPS